MNLVIDIGNTRVKVAVVDDGKVIRSSNSENFDIATIERLKEEFPLKRAIISSTRGEMSHHAKEVESVVGECLLFDEQTPIPIKNSYKTPATLGRDRLAAAVGATVLSSAENQMVIDLGSAITIDTVTRSGGFEGGVISPGVMMRFRALHEYTASLPLCSPTPDVLDVARTTNEAIEQGVMEGIFFEISGHIDQNSKKFGIFDIIFAGGDQKYFENRIKNTIFATRELVIVGLNRILEYNAK